VNLKEWAASQGVSYATARRWYLAGRLPVPAYQGGRLIVIGEPVPAAPAGGAVVHASVVGGSASGPRPSGRSGHRVGNRAGHVGGPGGGRGRIRVERESPRLPLGLLRDPKVSAIVVGHRNRFDGANPSNPSNFAGLVTSGSADER